MMQRAGTVGVILVNPAGQILLQQREDRPDLHYPGHWTTLGGAIETGELPDAAMRRELIEEIELQPPFRLWRCYQRVRADVLVDQYIYVGPIDRRVEAIKLNEGQSLGFFELTDLADLPVAFGFKPLFESFFATGRWRLCR